MDMITQFFTVGEQAYVAFLDCSCDVMLLYIFQVASLVDIYDYTACMDYMDIWTPRSDVPK